MAKAIDPVYLKAAAERLRWVLQQYPNEDDVRELLETLTPVIQAAIDGRVTQPVDQLPGDYNFGEGRYTPYRDPNVGEAYANFSVEMSGGLDGADEETVAEWQAYRRAIVGDNNEA